MRLALVTCLYRAPATASLTLDRPLALPQRLAAGTARLPDVGFALHQRIRQQEILAELGVTHATVTLNTVDPAIGAQIYSWVRDGNVVYRGRDAAELILGRQLTAIMEYGVATTREKPARSSRSS